MSKLEVEYTVKVKQYINWPEDELINLNYENLMCNLEVADGIVMDYEDISSIKKDGEDYDL